jgi:hypothetical protein
VVESGRRNILKKLMAAVAAGDRGAAFVLRVTFDAELKTAVRRAAVEVGRALPSDEVDAVATDFCTWLIAHASAWRPDGALPWRWAWAHLTTEVRKNQGYWPLTAAAPSPDDAEDTTLAAVADDAEVLDTFHRAAVGDDRVARVREVLEATSGGSDIALLLEYTEQAEAGDPSPSHTLGPRYGLSADAVRKRVQRARARAKAHIAPRPELADLGDLPVFGGRTARRRRLAA